MTFANTSISDVMATTIESRTKKIADNVTNNNALLKKLEMRGSFLFIGRTQTWVRVE